MIDLEEGQFLISCCCWRYVANEKGNILAIKFEPKWRCSPSIDLKRIRGCNSQWGVIDFKKQKGCWIDRFCESIINETQRGCWIDSSCWDTIHTHVQGYISKGTSGIRGLPFSVNRFFLIGLDFNFRVKRFTKQLQMTE